jgi:hypothetical protein
MASLLRKVRNIAEAAKQAESSLRRAAFRAKEEIQHQLDKIQKHMAEKNKEDLEKELSYYDPEVCDAEGLLITIPGDEEPKPIRVNTHDLYEKLSDALEPRQHVKVRCLSTPIFARHVRQIFCHIRIA